MKEFLPFRLDTANECLWRRRPRGGDERILLTPKAFGVLRCLLERAGRLVTHEELLDAVWPSTHVQPQAVKKVVLSLRSSLRDRAKKPLYIETLHRRGYRFIAAVREKSDADRVPRTPTLTGKLVGRESPLAELRACLGKTLARERQIVFITGEPGIGKTELADQFQRWTTAEVAALRVARGQCVEGYAVKEAYYPMLEALAQLCRGPDGESVVRVLAAQAPTWLIQFPELMKREQRDLLHGEVLGGTRERMLREISGALETIASENPLLLVLEDLQWADYATVDLISVLARRRASAKLMLIGTKRPLDIVNPEHPMKTLKDELLAHQLCQEIALEPLEEVKVAEYLSAESPDAPLPQGLAKLIFQHSEGNPLFMVAALQHLTERGLISHSQGVWKLEGPLREIALEVPSRLCRMITAPIERLTMEEQRVLDVASVQGTVFSTTICAGIANMDPEVFEEHCERLSRRSHIVCRAAPVQLAEGTASSVYRFVHALYRETCYRHQSPSRRARIHQGVGERLEVLFSDRLSDVAAELAYHFEASSDRARAVKYLRLATKTAQRHYANREATTTLHSALELSHKIAETRRVPSEIGIFASPGMIHANDCDTRAIESFEVMAARVARCDRSIL